jgi:hypothetical protein
MARALTLVLLPVLAGLFVTVVMASNRGADSTVTAAQRDPGPLTAAKLEALVRKAPPARNSSQTATRADCTPQGGGELHNPWRCTLRYTAGRQFTYRVRVGPDGSFVGTSGQSTISGCCVEFGRTG